MKHCSGLIYEMLEEQNKRPLRGLFFYSGFTFLFIASSSVTEGILVSKGMLLDSFIFQDFRRVCLNLGNSLRSILHNFS